MNTQWTMALTGAALVAACGGGIGGGVNGAGAVGLGAPTTMLVTSASRATFYRIDGDRLVVAREASLPGAVADVDWVGAEPVVLIADSTEDGSERMELGAIGELGYRPIAVPVGELWAVEHGEDLEYFDEPRWSLDVDADGAVWLGRCEWGYLADDNPCTEWVYARVEGGPLITRRDRPDEPEVGRAQVTAPASPVFGVAEVEEDDDQDDGEDDEDGDDDDDGDDHDDRPDARELSCRDAAGAIVTWPGEDDSDVRDVESVSWLANEPAIARVWAWREGYDYTLESTVFEGCAPSPRFADAEVIAGPGGAIALRTERHVGVIVGGRLLDTLELPGGEDGPWFSSVTFAPGR
ncbi:MAG: hypothetical protein R2939_17725 [Kofleriaceae bacterium]